MNKVSFAVKKWTARAAVALGALLGISACSTIKNGPNPAAGVYGPPPNYSQNKVEAVEDVYGPPVEEIAIDSVGRQSKATLLKREIEN